jgi:phosphoribosylglycinamide formyltransferase-1
MVSRPARRRVAILISGRGSNMAALIDAAMADPAYPAKIALVVSNIADAPGLAIARQAGVDTRVVASKPFGKDRAAFEAALQAALDEAGIELICLAGFMRLLTPQFVRHWQNRMLNIHPSLLPAFKGLDPHGQALQAGVKLSGASVHFVTEDTDAGPIVMQGAVAIDPRDSAETLAERVLAVEHRIYPAALRLVCAGRVRIENGACLVEAAVPDVALIAPTG